MSITTTLSVQKWGNSLVVRLPKIITRQAHFQLGTQVMLEAQENGDILIRPLEKHKLTLDERLEQFDLKKHGGEAMASPRKGKEKF